MYMRREGGGVYKSERRGGVCTRERGKEVGGRWVHKREKGMCAQEREEVKGVCVGVGGGGGGGWGWMHKREKGVGVLGAHGGVPRHRYKTR